ncbi:tripartite tricarboxylate transporter substrate binding protein, partial [Staphylococcus aureus]
LGQPIAIVNMPGAGGMTGWNQFVHNARPNGYELAAYNAPSFIAQSIHFKGRAQYNIHNMVPIANWGADPAV